MNKYVYLVGRGIGYSLSPRMQGAAAAALSLSWEYKLLDTEPEQLERTIQGLASPTCLGANITVPYKEQAAKLCHHLDGCAATLGAVNTIVNRQGKLWGYNTDPMGLKQDLDRLGINLPGRDIAILGAGGAAAAVLYLCKDQKVTLVCRRQQQGEELCQRLGIKAEIKPWAPLGSQDLVFNCTPKTSQWQTLLPQAHTVYDLNYTEKYSNANWHNGLGMLLFQGAAAFQLWTGRTPPLLTMASALGINEPL